MILEYLNGTDSFPSNAWPGGYPVYYITDDGGVLCPRCVNCEIKMVLESTLALAGDGWELVAADVNWEDAGLICDHCGERIESAYANFE